MKLIANKLTNLSALDVLKAFRDAYTAELGAAPSNSTLAILAAQSGLETGRWKSMHCFNFGNIRPPRDWAGAYCQFRCNEKINGKWVWFDPPSAGSNFLAFESAEEGARYYIHKLCVSWPEAWKAAMQGDTTGFVHGLKLRGYFTADEAPYRLGVQRMCTEFFDYMSRGLLGEQLPTPHEPDMAALHAAMASPVVIAPALLIGCKGEAVKAWQTAIGVTPDGSFGPQTQDATKAWQLQHGLPVTGAACEPDLQVAGIQ